MALHNSHDLRGHYRRCHGRGLDAGGARARRCHSGLGEGKGCSWGQAQFFGMGAPCAPFIRTMGKARRPITASTQGAGVLLSYCLNSPVQPAPFPQSQRPTASHRGKSPRNPHWHINHAGTSTGQSTATSTRLSVQCQWPGVRRASEYGWAWV